MSGTESYTLIPARMTPCNLHTFYSSVSRIEDYSRLMTKWEQDAIEAATTIYSGPFRLVSVSHSFWREILTATFMFEEL